MISILIPIRVKDNPFSNIKRTLKSIVDTSSAKEREQIEVLLKCDSDDEEAATLIQSLDIPLTIRCFTTARADGYRSLHDFYEYLFLRHSPAARFIMVSCDDVEMVRSGWISDILAINDRYCVIDEGEFNIEKYKNDNYLDPNFMYHGGWVDNCRILCPIWTVELIEVLQNFGWREVADMWVSLLSVILYNDYKINIRRSVETFTSRHYCPGELLAWRSPNKSIDDDNEQYWYKLVRQQARNVYLNMQYIKSLEH